MWDGCFRSEVSYRICIFLFRFYIYLSLPLKSMLPMFFQSTYLFQGLHMVQEIQNNHLLNNQIAQLILTTTLPIYRGREVSYSGLTAFDLGREITDLQYAQKKMMGFEYYPQSSSTSMPFPRIFYKLVNFVCVTLLEKSFRRSSFTSKIH